VRATAPGQSALLLLDAIDVLAGLGVDYAVVGAMAAAVHGAVRASADADAVLSISPDRGAAPAQAFVAAGFAAEFRRGDAADPIAAVLVVSDAHGNRIEFLIGVRGLEDDVFRRAVRVPSQERELRVAGVEDFVAMKVFAGGPPGSRRRPPRAGCRRRRPRPRARAAARSALRARCRRSARADPARQVSPRRGR
jgi:hypothetical protein